MSLFIRRLYTSGASSSTSAIAQSLLQRQLPSIRDWISPQPSHLLKLALAPYLNTHVQRDEPTTSGELPPGHHLVYFPPQLPEHLLLADGSDAEQSPGGPWTRRMWAGGSIDFSKTRPLRLFDEAVLRERVESVREKETRARRRRHRPCRRQCAWCAKRRRARRISCEGSGAGILIAFHDLDCTGWHAAGFFMCVPER